MYKIAIISLFASLPLLGQDDIVNSLLNHNWISDGDKTREWISHHRPDKAKNDKLMSLFGKMTCKFNNGIWSSWLNGIETSKEFKIVGITEREVVIITKEDIIDREIPIVLEFNESFTEYSIYFSIFDIREYFIINEQPAQQGDAPEPATNVDPASPSSQPPAR